MSIIPSFPFVLTNGTTADATQVMADFNQIFSSVNANAAENGTNASITTMTGLTSVSSAVNFSTSPTAPTPTTGDNSTKLATTAFMQATGDARYLQIANARTRLTANTTYYVATTGNDTTGNGTSGNPWATIQKAITYVQTNIDCGGYTITISVADGTYAPFWVNFPIVGANLAGSAPSLQITGNTTTPSSCIISSSTVNQSCIGAGAGAFVGIAGFTVTSSSNGSHGITVNQGGKIVLNGNMNFGTVGSTASHIASVDTGSYVGLASNYTISGNAFFHYYSDTAGEIVNTSAYTVTLTGTPSFNSFVCANRASNVAVSGYSFSGSAIGARYTAAWGGVIFTNGAGANYFPGNSAGSLGSGGYYI